MSDPEAVRRSVSADYARAVTSPKTGCCGDKTPKGVAAGIAGYTGSEIAALPAEAAVNSFGCGNPLAFSAVKPGQVVLDLGCGAGVDLLLAAKKVGATGRVIGVDMTGEMIAKARQNIAAAGLINVEVRKGIIEKLPIASGSVDWVISNCVINLSAQKSCVFAEIARVLKIHGAMLVSDIVAEKLPIMIVENPRLYSSCLAGAISERAYVDGLRRAGLAGIEVVDRLIYDAAQLELFIGSERQEPGEGCCGGGGAVDPALVRSWAGRLTGKIASIKIRAHKPE